MMNTKVYIHLCIALLVFAIEHVCVTAVEEGVVHEAEFDVEIGGETKSYVGQGDGLKCEFIYACQGGTLEKWRMTIYRESDGHYTCQVERTDSQGHHSYIYFESFKLKVHGGKITKAVVHNKDDKLIDPKDKEQFRKHNHYVEDGEDFEHSLGKILVDISRKKH